MNQKELRDAIMREKQERGVCILAHTYMAPEVLAVADITGDSFALSEAAAKLEAETVLLCGVRFMAETVKILSPQKTVLLSHKKATCPMAVQIAPDRVAAYRTEHPTHGIVAYINTTAELKAECDVCVTSSSAVRIVEKLPYDEILFLPDQNLGAYVRDQVTSKTIHLLDGCCPIHHQITADDARLAKEAHPGAKLAMHPECRPEALEYADMVGSTSAIIDFAIKEPGAVILGTERGVYDDLVLKYPEKEFYQLRGDKLVCPNMKMTTLQNVYDALTGRDGCEIELEEPLRLRAKRPIDNMLEYGKN